MIKLLSNSHSYVHTGVCILFRNSSSPLPSLQPPYTILSFAETTEVKFALLPDSLIESYSNSDEPYDKAGGYGIQGLAGSFITGISGCYYNVMGFPLYQISQSLRNYASGTK